MTRLPNRFPGVPETEFYKEQREDLMVKAVRSFCVTEGNLAVSDTIWHFSLCNAAYIMYSL